MEKEEEEEMVTVGVRTQISVNFGSVRALRAIVLIYPSL